MNDMPDEVQQLLRSYFGSPEDKRESFRRWIRVVDECLSPVAMEKQKELGKQISEVVKKRPRPTCHPPPKSYPDGNMLDSSIRSFAVHHDPPLKFEGMNTALDVLTASMSPEKQWYDFHYEIMAYKPGDGVYIKRVPGRGHRTSPEDTDKMEKGFG